MAVALDLPRADREVKRVPFLGLVLDEFIHSSFRASPPSMDRPRKPPPPPAGSAAGNRCCAAALLFGNRIEIVLIGIAGIDLLPDALEPGRRHERGGEIGID